MMMRVLTAAEAIGSEPITDATDVIVVKVVGECREPIKRAFIGTHAQAVTFIEQQRYWGMFDIMDRRSGRYLSFVLFRNRDAS